jgi:hypothetical protein
MQCFEKQRVKKKIYTRGSTKKILRKYPKNNILTKIMMLYK